MCEEPARSVRGACEELGGLCERAIAIAIISCTTGRIGLAEVGAAKNWVRHPTGHASLLSASSCHTSNTAVVQVGCEKRRMDLCVFEIERSVYTARMRQIGLAEGACGLGSLRLPCVYVWAMIYLSSQRGRANAMDITGTS